MRRKELILLLVAVSIVAFAGFFFVRSLSQNSQSSQVAKNISRVEINGHIVNVELALTNQERMKGLMGRDALDTNAGMLFVYQVDGAYAFWMKDTLIPLDILWIDKAKKLVYIKEDARPCEEDMKKLRLTQCPYIIPTSTARYILEVTSGWVAKNGVKVGDSVIFENM